MKHVWPLTPLGEILIERNEEPSSEDISLGRIKVIEKISFETGQISLRTNCETKTRMILIRPGDIVLSGINAAKGAISIYPADNKESIAATIHYSAYIPKPQKVYIAFLWWMLRSRFFQELLLEYYPGGIKTELKAKRFLPIAIPLPPLHKQREIITHIEQLIEKIQSAQSLHRQICMETDAILKAKLLQLNENIHISGVLGDILLVPPRNGWSVKCDNNSGGIPVLSLSAITGFRYKNTAFKRTSFPVPTNGNFWLKKGDLLITRSNSPELVGHVAIYDGQPTPCIYPDLIMRLCIQENAAEKRFVWYWLQSPSIRTFIMQNSKGTSSTMKKISQNVIMSIPFPTSLSVPEQLRIVAELDALQAEVDKLKKLQAQTAAELDALMPSILDKAFKGQL